METDSESKKNVWDLKFPARMWLITNTSNSFMNWSRKGTSVLINLVRLDQYLSSEFSIFKTKSRTRFLRQMDLYGFQKYTFGQEDPNSNDITICEYRNKFFKKNFPQLVSNLTMRLGIKENDQLTRLESSAKKSRKNILSPIEKARLNLEITLQMQSENKILKQKVHESDETSSSVIELSSEIFVDPYASVSHFPPRSDYAGYYGDVSPDKIKEFFEEYLPVYAEEDDGNDDDQVKDDTNLWQIPQSSILPSTSSSCNYTMTTPDTISSEIKINPSDSPSPVQYSINFDSQANNAKNNYLEILSKMSSPLKPISAGGIMGAQDNLEDYTGKDRSNQLKNIPSDKNNDFMSNILQPIYSTDANDHDMNVRHSNRMDSEDFIMDEFLKFESFEHDDNSKINDTDEFSMKENERQDFQEFVNEFHDSFNVLYN